MIHFSGEGSRLCDGVRRRDILRIGGLVALGTGLNLTDFLTTKAAADSVDRSFGRAKSCIILFLMGGPPQHSTWDPKPDAPEGSSRRLRRDRYARSRSLARRTVSQDRQTRR